MIQIEKTLSNFVKEQFPDFYKEEGPEFITFLTNYFEFLEQEGYPVDLARNLPEIRDIDSTIEPFLQYFSNKYMRNIPKQVFGNKREFVKRIKDVYRSKGSDTGFKLLFRLLYDEDIDIYLPKVDILKTSDGRWVQNRYFEITKSELNPSFEGQRVFGFNSEATAVVDSYQKRFVNNKEIEIFFLTDIEGTFELDEKVYITGVNIPDAPSIKGSIIDIEPIGLGINYESGDILVPVSPTDTGSFLEVAVTETFLGQGIIDFTVLDGGYGYSLDAVINIDSGSNTTGTGAAAIVSEIANTFVYSWANTIIEPYSNVALDAEEFAFDATDFSLFGQANLDTIIDQALIFNDIELGTIVSLQTINPGVNYNGDPDVTAFDPYIGPLNLSDGEGGFLGQNADILGQAVIGNVVSNLMIIDSGYGYTFGETIRLQDAAGSGSIIDAIPVYGSIGNQKGFWRSSRGFLNSDKYLQDSFYYQEFSYEIRSSRSLDKYINILYKICHPSGYKPFGRAYTQTTQDIRLIAEDFSIEQSS